MEVTRTMPLNRHTMALSAKSVDAVKGRAGVKTDTVLRIEHLSLSLIPVSYTQLDVYKRQDVLDAVAAFCESYELAPDLYASPELRQALDGAMQTLDGQTFVLDQQLQTALELCKLAAEEPQQYTALPDGSWKKN